MSVTRSPRSRAERLRAEAAARIAAASPARVELPQGDLRGSWTEPDQHRRTARIVLALALAGVLAGLVMLFTVPTFAALAALVGSTIVALLAYTALTVTTPTHVTLDGPRLVVTCGTEVDEFDLSGRIRRIATIGRPDRPNWRVQLHAADGKIIELGPHQVDPLMVQAAIARYRSSAPAPQVPPQRSGA